jgi:hypothetical protein
MSIYQYQNGILQKAMKFVSPNTKYSPYNHVYHKIPFSEHSLQHVFMVMSTIKLGTSEQLFRIKIGFVTRHFIKRMCLSGIELVKLLGHFSSGNLVIRMCATHYLFVDVTSVLSRIFVSVGLAGWMFRPE